jgi:hypothetical protein
MNTIKLFLVFYLLFLFYCNGFLFAQEPDTLWTKVIGGDSMDVAYDVEELWDGGFAVVGYTKSTITFFTGYDVWLIRTDSNGNVLWSKTYGGDGDEYGYSMKKTEDGGFILAGTTNSFGAGDFDFYVIKTDSIGDTLWTKTFGGINNDICWSIDNTIDNGFIIVGEKDSYPLTPDVMIIKLKFDGSVEWEKVYGTTNPDYIYSVNTLQDGSFTLSGYFYVGFGSGGFDGWLFKLGSNGDSLWSQLYGGEFTEIFYSHSPTNNFGNICVGRSLQSLGGYLDVYLVKTDSLGNEQWSQTLDYDNDGDLGFSVQQTTDGGYIIAGQARPFDGGSLSWVVRTDSLGNVLWDKTFPYEFPKNPTEYEDGLLSVKQTMDGGYIVAGYQSGDHKLQVFLVRIASDIVPVELTSFTATVTRNAVSLNWQTATETNNSGFEIERKQVGSPQSSVGNLEWNKIGFVPGFGTTTEPKSYSFTDENLSSGKYQYRLKQIDFDGSFEYSNIIEVEINSPTEFSLGQNYPNPFNPTTNIKYTIPTSPQSPPSKGGEAKQGWFTVLKVFDVLGNEVATLVNQPQQPGIYEVEFNASQLSSGVYYYQLRSGSFVETKKMIVIK